MERKIGGVAIYVGLSIRQDREAADSTADNEGFECLGLLLTALELEHGRA